jgi:arsenate reductase (thioredoxin)
MNENKRVLFVCLGNACRSQMAEAFARLYGSDVLVPASAGLTPAMRIAPDTVRAMAQKNADLRDHFPKHLSVMTRAGFDLAVNMSGRMLPDSVTCPIRTWKVRDPINLDFEEHCKVRDQIEKLVMELILELRREHSKGWLERRRT